MQHLVQLKQPEASVGTTAVAAAAALMMTKQSPFTSSHMHTDHLVLQGAARQAWSKSIAHIVMCAQQMSKRKFHCNKGRYLEADSLLCTCKVKAVSGIRGSSKARVKGPSGIA